MPTPSPNQIVALGSGAVEISLGVQLIPLCRRTSGELSHTIVHQRYFHQAAHNRADRCANMQDRIFRPSVGGGRSGGKKSMQIYPVKTGRNIILARMRVTEQLNSKCMLS